MTDLIRIEVACSSEDEADHISTSLIDAGLAACVQSHAILSRYKWQGAAARDSEILLIIKTTAQNFETICEMVKRLHSYDTPEIMAVPVLYADDDYAAWAKTETTR